MARKKLKSATDQRKFTMVYHDFLECNFMTSPEKLVFIALKRYADSNNQCFPSLKKIADVTRISKRKIQDILKSLEQKHIISKASRSRADGGDTSNLYTLYDFAGMWDVGRSEEIEVVVNEYEEMELVSKLRARGYTVTKENGLDSVPPKVNYQAPKLDQSDIIYHTTDVTKSQPLERYTIDQIRQLYDYDVLVTDNPYHRQDIDAVMDILHTAINTTKNRIRVAGEDKPSMVVIGKLLKLTASEIMYVIKKYSEQSDRIKNPTAYMLTLLYGSKEQMHLDLTNRVQHDMAHGADQSEAH